MADRDTKRYYWLKLDKDFFKRHDIRVVESMPNGKDYILFYLKLLCESTSHEGYLRFNEAIPYDDNMLATITNTNIDIVRSAIKIFRNLEMMSVMDDGTLYLEQVNKMIGSETGMAQRIREYRAKQKEKLAELENKGYIETPLKQQSNLDIDKEKDIEIDIDKEKDKMNIDEYIAPAKTFAVRTLIYENKLKDKTKDTKEIDDFVNTYLSNQPSADVSKSISYILSWMPKEVSSVSSYVIKSLKERYKL